MVAVKQAFGKSVVSLPLQYIVAQREMSPRFLMGTTYKRIAASVKVLGLIEPIAVFARGANDYLLLDGHVRLHVLKAMDATEVPAIIECDDEAYSYNKRVNHAYAIAETFMILKALSNGVSEEMLAAVLNLDVASVRKKRTMLDGICAEAVEILCNTGTTASAFAALKKMKSVRQVAVAEHMRASGNYSATFARALLEATRPEFRLDPPSKRKVRGNSARSQAMLEEESDSVLRDLKALEHAYGIDVLTLSIASAYLKRLLSNSAVERFLEKYHGDILAALRTFLAETKPSGTIALGG
jgi:hypothetical protein